MSEPVEQRSDEWFAARCGRITGSRFHDVIATTKADKAGNTRPLAGRAVYMKQLAFERTAGIARQGVTSKSLAWGTEVEQFAREAYELRTGSIVTAAEFVTHPRHDFIGCSCDGLVDADGVIEIKSPHSEEVHIETWLSGMPADHRPQVQGHLFVTGRAWCDFISYDPRQGERLRLYVERIERDDTYIAGLEAALLQFEAELQDMVATLLLKAA